MFPTRGTLGDEPLLEVEGLLAPGLAEPVSFSRPAGRDRRPHRPARQRRRAASSRRSPACRRRTPGSVLLDGEEISLRSRAATLQRGIAYCSADRKRDGIFAERPIRENLSSPWIRSVAPGGWISAAARTRASAREIAARFAIDVKRLGSAVGTLSAAATSRRSRSASGSAPSPKVMLLEEPTRGVDIGARAEIYQRLRDLCAAGLGIVVASSDTAEVLGLSDTIATFYRGRLTGIRPQAEWTEDALDPRGDAPGGRGVSEPCAERGRASSAGAPAASAAGGRAGLAADWPSSSALAAVVDRSSRSSSRRTSSPSTTSAPSCATPRSSASSPSAMTPVTLSGNFVSLGISQSAMLAMVSFVAMLGAGWGAGPGDRRRRRSASSPSACSRARSSPPASTR